MCSDTCEITIYQCAKCSKWLPLTTQFFSVNRATKTGYSQMCKICTGSKSYKHISLDGYRRCSKCKRELPRTLEYFPTDTRRPDGFKSECRDCKRKQRTPKEPKVFVAATTITCTKCDKTFPATTEYFSKDSRLKNGLRSICKVCARRYAQETPNRHREYYRLNKGKYRISEARRRARRLALPDTFTHEQWVVCLEYFNHCCAVCGNQLRDLFGNVKPHADHWLPLSSAECIGTVADNMICLCSTCNLSKQAQLPDVWLKQKYGTRKANIILARVQEYFAWVLSQANQEQSA